MHSHQLGHIITKLLSRQPLVVLPGFGGFVKDQVSAELDELRNRIHPPRNTVIFNVKLSHNDGLLVATVADELDLSYSDADKWLTDAISELRFRLNNGETISLDGLGTLRKAIEGNVEFKALDVPEIQDEFFGLKPISLKPVEKDNVDKVREFVAADGPVATKVRTLPIARVAKYAAAAAAVGFFLWLPIQQGVVNNGKMLAHQLNPFAVSIEVAYQAREFKEDWISKGFEKQDVLSDQFTLEYLKLHLTKNATNAIVVRTDAVPSSEVHLEAEEIPTESNSIDKTTTSFKVIAATFNSRSEAADYVAKMIKRGFGAEYAGVENSKHLVDYGTYSSLQDANKMLKSVRISNKEARIVSGS